MNLKGTATLMRSWFELTSISLRVAFEDDEVALVDQPDLGHLALVALAHHVGLDRVVLHVRVADEDLAALKEFVVDRLAERLVAARRAPRAPRSGSARRSTAAADRRTRSAARSRSNSSGRAAARACPARRAASSGGFVADAGAGHFLEFESSRSPA